MKITLEITGLKSPTTNHTHKVAINKKTKKRFLKKTMLYEQYESMFKNKLRDQRVKINKLNKYFDTKIHCLHIDYKFYFPIEKKDGTLSLTAGDNDNMTKPTQDTLFNSLVINDAYVTKSSQEKINADTPRIEIIITVKNYR